MFLIGNTEPILSHRKLWMECITWLTSRPNQPFVDVEIDDYIFVRENMKSWTAYRLYD